jgi:hypothetical protein
MNQPFLYTEVSINKMDNMYLHKLSHLFIDGEVASTLQPVEETLYGISEGLKVCVVRKKVTMPKIYMEKREGPIAENYTLQIWKFSEKGLVYIFR